MTDFSIVVMIICCFLFRNSLQPGARNRYFLGTSGTQLSASELPLTAEGISENYLPGRNLGFVINDNCA